MREEELRRFPCRCIECVNSSDGRVLRSNREIRETFRSHFRDRFIRCPDLQVQEFCNYLADFPHLGQAEAASCEGVVTECEVRNALKQTGLNESPGLDGLPDEVYLRMSHIFVPILTSMFNHWFAQGAIPGSLTKGVITLLKKGGRHVRGELNDYRPMTLLNTELKILARVLANRLQLVIRDLTGLEQNYAVKVRSIQDNLHLVRQILEGIEDDTEAALINLYQSKAFDWVDHRFLAAVLETADSNWSSANELACCTTTHRAFAIERSARKGFPLFLLLYVLALEPLLRRLRDERALPALRGVSPIGSVRAKISVFADDIVAVKMPVERYEKLAGAIVNLDKREGLQLGALRGGVPLPGPFRWSDGPIHILGVWFGPGLLLERNWLEVRAKVEAQVATRLRRRLSLQVRAEVCAVYIFPLIVYRLSVLPLPKDHRVALGKSLFKLLGKSRSSLVRKQVSCQRPRDGGLNMPDLESHWLAGRLAYLSRCGIGP